MVALLAVALARRAELEGPEEVGGLLEVLSDRVDLVDQVLDADDVVFACIKNKFRDFVKGKIRNRFNLISEERVEISVQNSENLIKISCFEEVISFF